MVVRWVHSRHSRSLPTGFHAGDGVLAVVLFPSPPSPLLLSSSSSPLGDSRTGFLLLAGGPRDRDAALNYVARDYFPWGLPPSITPFIDPNSQAMFTLFDPAADFEHPHYWGEHDGVALTQGALATRQVTLAWEGEYCFDVVLRGVEVAEVMEAAEAEAAATVAGSSAAQSAKVWAES